MIAHSALLHGGEASLPALDELFDSLAALMSYSDKLCDRSGLLLRGARGDWIPPDSQAVHTSVDVVSAFTHTLCVGYMAEIARALNRTSEVRRAPGPDGPAGSSSGPNGSLDALGV